MSRTLRLVVLALALFIWAPAAFAGVTPGQPFPTDLEDGARRHAGNGQARLPSPAQLHDEPVGLRRRGRLNTLDGFSLRPRISIPFSGAIDLSTVSSNTVFLADPAGDRIGINQVVWEPLASTLHLQPERLLEQRRPTSSS